MPYAMEFRVAVAAAHDDCGSSIEVAELFGCSASWVRRLIQRRRETGSLEPLERKLPDRHKLDEDDLTHLSRLIEKQPDMTLGELADALDNKASVPTVWRATQALGLRLKKDSARRGAGSARRSGNASQLV